MDKPDRMKAELALVLSNSKFARSPTLSRLLSFLVEQAIAGHGNELKSYSVAVDGLGRSPDFDSRGDTYPRVQVARLRRSLDAFYAFEGSDHRERLIIPSGSYEVELAPNIRVGSVRRGFRAMFLAASMVPGWRRTLLAGLMAVAAAALITNAMRGALLTSDASTWKENDFPYIYVHFDDEGAEPEVRAIGKILEQDLTSALSRYEAVRSTTCDTDKVKYSIIIEIIKFDRIIDLNINLTYKSNSRTIYVWKINYNNT